jgi:BASS family bile acid:Na+ symporter
VAGGEKGFVMTLATLATLMMQASIVLTVAALGLHARRGDVRSLLADRGRLASSLLAMHLVMPLLAVGVAVAFDLHPAVEVALVALSVSPVPRGRPWRGVGGGGRASYAVGLAVVSAVLAVVIVPAAVSLVASHVGSQGHLAASAVARLVASTVLVPVAVGVALRRLARGFVDRVARPAVRLSALLFTTATLLVVAASLRSIVPLIGNGTLLAITLFLVAGLATGHLLGGPAREDRVVLALSTASRHPGVAAAAGAALAPGETRVLAAIVLYLLMDRVLSSAYLLLIRHPAMAAAPVGSSAP